MPKKHNNLAGAGEHPKNTEAKRNKAKLRPNVKSRRTLLFVLFWIAALLIVGIMSFTVSRNNALAANKKAEAALDALKANDDTRLYNLGTEELKKSNDTSKVKTLVNEWTKVISQATNGTPELVSKQATVTKDGKKLTTLVYKYQVQPGKSKINQKELFVKIETIETNEGLKISAFNMDVQKQK